MGEYTTRMISDKEIIQIIETIRDGYIGEDGTPHKPNEQIATILFLQANLGCRIGDIVNLKTENIVSECGVFKLDMVEQKTGKRREFIVPSCVKDKLDKYADRHGINSGRYFTIKEAAVWKQMRNATAYLGMDNVSCHSFRKAAGYRVYRDSGMDLALTSQYYNHANPSTTLRYLKRSTKQMDEVLSKSVCMV